MHAYTGIAIITQLLTFQSTSAGLERNPVAMVAEPSSVAIRSLLKLKSAGSKIGYRSLSIATWQC